MDKRNAVALKIRHFDKREIHYAFFYFARVGRNITVFSSVQRRQSRFHIRLLGIVGKDDYVFGEIHIQNLIIRYVGGLVTFGIRRIEIALDYKSLDDFVHFRQQVFLRVVSLSPVYIFILVLYYFRALVFISEIVRSAKI